MHSECQKQKKIKSSNKSEEGNSTYKGTMTGIKADILLDTAERKRKREDIFNMLKVKNNCELRIHAKFIKKMIYK
jgi:hypothetical protein